MELLYDLQTSETYVLVSRILVLVCYLAAFGAILIAATYSFRAERRAAATEPKAPWTQIIGALRDMFVVMLLYAAESLFLQMQQAAAAVAMQEMSAPVLVALAPLAGQYGGLLTTVLSAVICIRRVVKLSHWLAHRDD